jgi:hypothetical protein
VKGEEVDFYQIKQKSTKNGVIEVYPDFRVCRSKDLMVRGKSFYAIWNDNLGLWSTDEYDVQALVDADLMSYREKIAKTTDGSVHARLMGDFSTNSWSQFRNYLNHISDNSHQLDTKLTFADTKVKKTDYVSKRLPYSLEDKPCDAYEELISTLYDPEERAKIEWAIGSVIAGDSKDIQKFLVFYGEAGAGKSTVLNIIQKLFEGYYTTFEAKALTSSNNSFSTEVFRHNPLVAIQHDGDLSKIEDNTKLNSIVSHEEMTMNEKYKPSYTARINCFLFMASNQPVKITDGKSGIIRRLIDVNTSGRKVPTRRYMTLISQIDFELGAIANRCLNVYRDMGKHYYSTYRPISMMFKTDVFYNFVESELFGLLQDEDGISLSQAYDIYKAYCEDSALTYKLPKYKFRDELKNYFDNFSDVTRKDGKQIRSYFSGFIKSKFVTAPPLVSEEPVSSLVLDQTESLLDGILENNSAQYASKNGFPLEKWAKVKTVLKDLDTSKLHYVKMDRNHIVIDFDIKDSSGNKSPELNIHAASLWPPTYAEYSKSKAGIHLHYIYDGDVDKLSGIYEEGIEVKVFRGDASLRRQLSKCNNVPVATISSGLPLKGDKVINFTAVKSEEGIRRLIERNLQKEIHGATKPSIDFIYTILEEAYASGIPYDLTSMRPKVMAFANNSSNNSEYCVTLVAKMKFQSEEIEEKNSETEYDEESLVFYDVEVFPNVLIVCWKYAGDEHQVVNMINPTPMEVERLFHMKLVGFNCRRYDNHILYGRYLGYNNAELFDLSTKIVNNSRNAMFREAYNISYTDVYDFTTKKQSLKKYEIDLGILHSEFGHPWDQPLPDKLLEKAVSYCGDDVRATEATFYARKSDFVARQILADLSGLSLNDTTQRHTAKIIFGDDRNPQEKFVYTDLSEMFPGYTFDHGKSFYKGETPGEGGYVYAEPGIYENVALLDIASMHPTSIENLNLFGPYTKNYSQIKAARIAIKHKNFDAARGMLGGKLNKYLTSEEESGDLAYALKIALNTVYGLTFASFDNPFKDVRNKDNIVAKRGALFMLDLKLEVQKRGFTVVHCKTDSIKIPNPTKEIIDFVFEFGKKYGYDFEHEETYSKFCLVNDAVYIARAEDGHWTATGAQFAHPYVFKKLFSKEEITIWDLCETKAVTTEMYLDMNEALAEDEHNYIFVGKVGLFCPIIPGFGGGILLRKKNDKYYAVTGTKGYRWLEKSTVSLLEKEDKIDLSYHQELVDKAIETIEKYGPFESLIS